MLDPYQLTENMLAQYAIADNSKFTSDDTYVTDVNYASGHVTFTARCDHEEQEYDVPLLHLLAFVYASKS